MGNSLKKKCEYFTIDQINAQNKIKPKYILIDDKIYDISSILDNHPGGYYTLWYRCELLCDCKEDFFYHSNKSQKKWEKLFVGKITD